ncbi:MAG: ABC transporter permease [Lachnospiraceae bacterium]|nr:ABC transporter permease [Lachnospiraceae bacterium]
MVIKLLVIILLDLFIILFLKRHAAILNVCNEIYGQRELVLNLAKNDFKTRYVGSYLGVVWAFIRPVITVVVYWFVFQIGMRSSDVNNFPFVLWLIAGLVPWFYFQDALGSGTNSLIEYQYLVKKIVFNINTLPIVKIISAMIVHFAFVIFTIIIYWCYGHIPDLYTLQLIYYSFCMAVFTLALVYFTSSAVIFFRDINQIIGVILEVGIWITPIMWQLTVIPDFLRWIFKLNPMYYIVSGYRDSLINKVWFWDNLYLTAYFWGFTVILFILGTRVFNKLKIHFADVL